jgi:hypothetical protein
MKPAINFLGPIVSRAAQMIERWTDLNPEKDALAISSAKSGLEDILFSLQREWESIAQQATSSSSDSNESFERSLAVLATQAWRMNNRLHDPTTKEPRDTLDSRDCRGVARSLETIMDELRDLGITIKDRTGEDYDEGLPEKVIQGEPRPNLAKPRIIETLKPSIFLNQKFIQLGDIIVGIPTNKDS